MKTSTGRLSADKSSRIQPDFEDQKKSDDNERENSFGDLEGKKHIIKLKYDTPAATKKFEI